MRIIFLNIKRGALCWENLKKNNFHVRKEPYWKCRLAMKSGFQYCSFEVYNIKISFFQFIIRYLRREAVLSNDARKSTTFTCDKQSFWLFKINIFAFSVDDVFTICIFCYFSWQLDSYQHDFWLTGGVEDHILHTQFNALDCQIFHCFYLVVCWDWAWEHVLKLFNLFFSRFVWGRSTVHAWVLGNVCLCVLFP